MCSLKKPQTKLFRCVGGPFNGKRIRLTDRFPVTSAVFSVPSYNNGEKGRYIGGGNELRDGVSWEKLE